MLDKINSLNSRIDALKRQLENARSTHLIAAQDPIARLMVSDKGEAVRMLEGKLAALKAEREQLFEEAFTASLAKKTQLEKELKARKQAALSAEWFMRRPAEERTERLKAMQGDIAALQRELDRF